VKRLRSPLRLLGIASLLLFGLCASAPSSARVGPPSTDIGGGHSGAAEDLFDRAAAIYLPLAQSLEPVEGYPRSITDGETWMLGSTRSWTSGFFSGVLWRLYERTGEEALRTQAERWAAGLAGETTIPSHDVGFIINSSFGQGYRLTGEPWYRDVLLKAADQLATRYDPDVRAIRSWGAMRHFVYPVAIDGMMNIELLFWASEHGGGPELADIAWQHAHTTMVDHVRCDGTTFHVVDYDPSTGAELWKGTVQGLADTSTWSRGQAWAIYGFTVAARETGDPSFLWTAEKTADAFLDLLPEDWIPCWDFDAESIPGEPRDASAAAVAASGLWELAGLTDDVARRSRYRSASYAIVERLSAGDYSAEGAGMPALLLHSTGHRPHNSEVDVPVIYAEYYFLEALSRQRPPVPGATRPEQRRDAFRPGSPRLALGASPNPFRGSAEITWGTSGEGHPMLTVLDVSGRVVRRIACGGAVSSGRVVWDGRSDAGAAAGSGVYFLRLECGGRECTERLVLLR